MNKLKSETEKTSFFFFTFFSLGQTCSIYKDLIGLVKMNTSK